MAKNKKKSTTLSLNFKDVKTFKTPPEGNYLVKVKKAELTTSSNDNEMISWEFEVSSGSYDGSKLFYNTNTGKDSLWKLREVLEALGQEVPDGKLELDLEDLEDLECGVVVYHEVYDGKNRAKIADFLSSDEIRTGEEADDEDTVSKPSSDDEDLESMDEDELEEFVKENGLDIDLDDYSSIKKKRKAIKEALEGSEEDDSEEDSEDEDSDETKYSEDQINDMSVEDLEELNNDLELDIEGLDDMTKKTARRNVIKALKKRGLLDD